MKTRQIFYNSLEIYKRGYFADSSGSHTISQRDHNTKTAYQNHSFMAWFSYKMINLLTKNILVSKDQFFSKQIFE